MKNPGFIAKLVKIISFISFTIVSYILSLSMYLSLGQEPWEKIVFVVINTSLEAFKVYNVIMASTFLYFAKVGHTLYSRKELLAKAGIRYIIYGTVAITSILAAAGFTVSVVDRMSFTSESVDLTEQIASIDKKIQLLSDRIILQQSLINTQQNIIADTENLSQQYVSRKQQIISDATSQISKATENILSAQVDIASLESTRYDITAVKIDSRKGVKRTMFVILGEVFGIPPTTIILVVLLVVSVLIEVGAVTTAPHSLYIEGVAQPISSSPAGPKPKIKKRFKNPSAKEEIPPLVKLPVHTEQIENVQILEPDLPIRPHHKKKEVLFIERLLQNGAHPYLKDRYEAGREAGLATDQIEKIFSYLHSTPGPDGSKFIEFKANTGKWYPNYSAETLITDLESKSLL